MQHPALRPWPVTLNYNTTGTLLYGWTLGADPAMPYPADITVRVHNASGALVLHSVGHCPGAVHQFRSTDRFLVAPPFSLTAAAERPA